MCAMRTEMEEKEETSEREKREIVQLFEDKIREKENALER